MDQTPATLRQNRLPLPPGPYSVADYYQLAGDGLLRAEDRVELIQGELIWMNAIGSPHLSVLNRLVRSLTLRVGDRAVVSGQNSVRLDDGSQPQSDVALLRPRMDHYRAAVPLPPDVLLLVEVADTSLDYDRAVKGPLYARHGIGEYWIVNLDENLVEVHRNPGPDGYTWFERSGLEKELTVEGLPGLSIPVREFLP